MKKTFLFFIGLMLIYQVKSCDACGGSLGNSYFGLLPQMSTSFIGMNYSYSRFSAQMRFNSEVLEDEISDDSFSRFEVNARFKLYDRLQASIIIPYSFNQMDGSHQKIKDHGIGDPSVLLFYRFFNKSSDDKLSINQTLLIGVGVKLPFGQFDKQEEEEVINRNFQLGSGSIDYIMTVNHTLMFENMGLNADLSLKLNSQNADDYTFGNQFTVSSNIFWVKKFTKLILVPIVGAYFEYGGIHKEGLVEQSNTGGEVFMSNTGLQFMWNKLTLNASYKIPIYQRFNSDNIAIIKSENRLSMSFNYNF
ncbi:MAG: hypothetical protein ACI9A7_002200 [Cyclobacteriaceae bacterium]